MSASVELLVHRDCSAIDALKSIAAAHISKVDYTLKVSNDPAIFVFTHKVVLNVPTENTSFFTANSICKYLLKDQSKKSDWENAVDNSLCEYEESLNRQGLPTDQVALKVLGKVKVDQLKINDVVGITAWCSLFFLNGNFSTFSSWYEECGNKDLQAAVGCFFLKVMPNLSSKATPQGSSVSSSGKSDDKLSRAELEIDYLKKEVETLKSLKGSTASSGKEGSEVERLVKENTKLQYRVDHVLRYYKKDEEDYQKQIAELQKSLLKAEYRIEHLKKSLEAEEKKNQKAQ